MWCRNCMSDCCPCVVDDPDELEEQDEPDYEEQPISEKEIWEAENKQLDNGL